MKKKNNLLPHETFLTLACRRADRGMNAGWGGPFGAVVVRQGKVVSQAQNTVLKHRDPTRHAEINAIQQASRKLGRYDLSDCVIYSTTEPCPMCFAAIHWARIPAIYYSTSITQVRKLGFNELPIGNRQLKNLGHSHVKIVRIVSEQCRRLLNRWKSLPISKTY